MADRITRSTRARGTEGFARISKTTGFAGGCLLRFLFFEAYVKSEIFEADTDRIARDVPQIPELIGEIMGVH